MHMKNGHVRNNGYGSEPMHTKLCIEACYVILVQATEGASAACVWRKRRTYEIAMEAHPLPANGK
jgi:hypothetical protein